MTSSFSNLVLAGLVLASAGCHGVHGGAEASSKRAAAMLPEIDPACERAATRIHDRIVVLLSSPALGWGAPSRQPKSLEMTAAASPWSWKPILGVAMAPCPLLNPETFVLCLFSSDPVRRLYEADPLRELRAKKIGYLVGIAHAADVKG